MKYTEQELLEQENKARNRFEQDYSTKLDIKVVKWIEERYAFIDACVTSGNTNCYLELKERLVDIDKYKSVLIEKSKVDIMITKTKDKDVIPLLICMYQDNKCIAFNLKTTRPLEEVNITMQATNYTNNKKLKDVYMYSISDAIIIS